MPLRSVTINTIASDDILNAAEAGSALIISGTSTANRADGNRDAKRRQLQRQRAGRRKLERQRTDWRFS
ncbi:hypothetical protein ACLB1Q_13075 [Escherichia coli]